MENYTEAMGLLLRHPVRGVVAVALGITLSAPPATPAEAGSAVVSKPKVAEDHIAYSKSRKRQMAGYSRRHYGHPVWRLRNPDVIVLHFTGGPSYSSAWNTFQANSPNRGEMPGVCTHFIVKKGGGIAEVVHPRIRCRHAIGLNHTALGVEMVQETGKGAHWADRQILKRKPQVAAALKLVKWLKSRYGIKLRNVIGHSMANDSRFFKDLQGWRNTHTDWLRPDVKEFRRRLRAMN